MTELASDSDHFAHPLDHPLLRVKQQRLKLSTGNRIESQELSGVTISVTLPLYCILHIETRRVMIESQWPDPAVDSG